MLPNTTKRPLELPTTTTTPTMTTTPSQRRLAAAHRRGMSLDIPRINYSTQHNPTYTNPTGTARAQQQRIKVRPGPQAQSHHQRQHSYQQFNYQQQQQQHQQQQYQPQHYQQNYPASRSQGILDSCLTSPLEISQGSTDMFPSLETPLDSPFLDISTRRNSTILEDSIKEFENTRQWNGAALLTPDYLSAYDPSPFQQWCPVLPNSDAEKHSSGTIRLKTKSSSQKRAPNSNETLRPQTPQGQNRTYGLPPSPTITPHGREERHEFRANRFADGYDASLEETIKPKKRRVAKMPDFVFPPQAEQADDTTTVPSSPSSTKRVAQDAFSDPKSNISTSMDNYADAMSRLGQDTMANAKVDFGNLNQEDLAELQMSCDGLIGNGSSSHRRNESFASMASEASAASAASIAGLDLESTKVTTGVSADEISRYMEGPNDHERKWKCIFEDCGKKFGRKENIKSHVQTHLGDRQYECPSCNKCFVRQHDLKRHVKTHTGFRPYPCECGNYFARHDALTRHRQRGMCVGAFDGIVRKQTKRGRPRKIRPTEEEATEEQEEGEAEPPRKRHKNLSICSNMTSSTSQSEYWDSSVMNSPISANTVLDRDMLKLEIDNDADKGMQFSTAPMPFSRQRAQSRDQLSTPALSPMAHASPTLADSPTSYVSPAELEASPWVLLSPAASAANVQDVAQYETQSETALPSFPADDPVSVFLNDFGLDNATLPVTQVLGDGIESTMNPSSTDLDEMFALFSSNQDSKPAFNPQSSTWSMGKFDRDYESSMFFGSDDAYLMSDDDQFSFVKP